MPVIRHYRIGKNAHIGNFFGLQQEVGEKLVVVCAVEYLEATSCSIDYVVDVVCYINSRKAWYIGFDYDTQITRKP